MLRSGIKCVDNTKRVNNKKKNQKLTSPRCLSLTLKQEQDDFWK